VRVEGKLAGFVLLRRLEAEEDEPLWQMAKFFVLLLCHAILPPIQGLG
jgi:hypothetical protein